jgi:hypothetical protein
VGFTQDILNASKFTPTDCSCSIGFHLEHSGENVSTKFLLTHDFQGKFDYEERIPCCQIPFNFSRSFRKNLASVEILSLKISLQCSSMNRVVEFVGREFPDMMDDESKICVRKVPKLAV